MPSDTLTIDPEFRSLVPPLSGEELEQLEENLVAEGCRDPLVAWDGTLIDGHNRHDICTRRGIPFQTVQRSFPSREAAMVWVIHNQFGRRNLNHYQRAELALKLKPLVAAKAKENQGTRTDFFPNLGRSCATDKELAKAAGVSHGTIHKAKVIVEKAPEPLKEELRRGETSVNAAYKAVTDGKPLRERKPKADAPPKEKKPSLKSTLVVQLNATFEKHYGPLVRLMDERLGRDRLWKRQHERCLSLLGEVLKVWRGQP